MTARFPILCIVESRPEDAILSSGLIRFLHDQVPGAAFTIVAGERSAPLFRDTPGLEQLLVIEGDGKGGRLLKLWSQVRSQKWGLVVDLRGTDVSGFLNRKKRAVRAPWPKDQPLVHKVLQAAHVLKLEDDPPAPFLFTSPETEAAALEALGGDISKGGDGPILAVGPGADWIGKTWQAERFAKIAGHLLGPDGPMADGRLLIVGEDNDREAVHTIRMIVGRDRVIEAQGKLEWLQACALLKQCRFYVGNDSIWTHLATAARIPVLAVFGPSDEHLEGPWGAMAAAVRGPKQMDDFRIHDPRLDQTINHMYDVPVDKVLEGALRLYARTEPGADLSSLDLPDAPDPEPQAQPEPVAVEALEPEPTDPEPAATDPVVETDEAYDDVVPAPESVPEPDPDVEPKASREA